MANWDKPTCTEADGQDNDFYSIDLQKIYLQKTMIVLKKEVVTKTMPMSYLRIGQINSSLGSETYV